MVASAGTSRTDVVQPPRRRTRWQFIREMTEGLDTVIGENGVRLSGGNGSGSPSRARSSRTRRC